MRLKNLFRIKTETSKKLGMKATQLHEKLDELETIYKENYGENEGNVAISLFDNDKFQEIGNQIYDIMRKVEKMADAEIQVESFNKYII